MKYKYPLLLFLCFILPMLWSAKLPVSSKEKDMSISASVGMKTSDFLVEIPASIQIGELNSNEDYHQFYSIFLFADFESQQQKLTIQTSDQKFHLKHEHNLEALLPCYNHFQTQVFTKSGTSSGNLTIYKEDIANAPIGSYSGTLHFTITSEALNSSKKEPTKELQESSNYIDGQYVGDVCMKNANDFSNLSMCNPLFHEKADIQIEGKNARITLYVIDPVPNYTKDGTPISDLLISYEGQTYKSSIDSTHQELKSYPASTAFIPNSGNYKSSVITFSLPVSALEASKKGLVKATANIKTMNTEVSFFISFSNLEKGHSKTEIASTVSSTPPIASSLPNGTYGIAVKALKETDSTDSMMNQYMLPTAKCVVQNGTSQLTIYTQHTIAGTAGGGPRYMSYNGTHATKTENIGSVNGINYDSFTFQFTGDVPDELPIEMFIEKMQMAVKARLIFSKNSQTQFTELASITNETALKNNKSTKNNALKNTGTISNKSVPSSNKKNTATSQQETTKEIKDNLVNNNTKPLLDNSPFAEIVTSSQNTLLSEATPVQKTRGFQLTTSTKPAFSILFLSPAFLGAACFYLYNFIKRGN